MKEFRGKVAVITGAASGIGRALAERCVREGMKTVLADVEQDTLDQAETELRAKGGAVLAVRTDVAKAAEVEALARQTLDAFGAIHLLFNNAGVIGSGAAIWENTQVDWEWVLGVNLWGVIHGVRVFTPIMLAQNVDCHIVNTASMAGVTAGPGMGVYRASKHAAVSISETLYLDLAQRGAKIKVSVLCPGWVNTRIMDAARNRPAELQNQPHQAHADAQAEALEQTFRQTVRMGMSPQQMAEIVFDAIRDERLYIVTHPDWKPMLQTRMMNILQERNP